ncbi:response regulator [Flavobacterium sp. MFBS3-15]|uniref:response regulator n=1 Tax=Flavobacterium sp. MFBS3-15 TaxID=2989816 RepID=UPI00223699CD|nr:response regulator [Flavobacterium sp. MFBS3-15]MCW4467945.1 response regulator [Flavobacterium sp. MFBS3-15]
MKAGFTIFYTDDDQDDLEFFREIIESIDANVSLVTHTNGDQLLHALNNPPPQPHLVFLDINMPGMTGFEVLKKVRQSHDSLPVVMFSTSGDDETINKSRQLGASYYVTKSGIFEQLKKSIEHAISINWGSFIPTENNFVYSY